MTCRITGSADVMEAQQGEGAFPGSLSTGRAPALGLNSISAVGTSTLADLVSQVAASWTDRMLLSICLNSRSQPQSWFDVKQMSASCVHQLDPGCILVAVQSACSVVVQAQRGPACVSLHLPGMGPPSHACLHICHHLRSDQMHSMRAGCGGVLRSSYSFMHNLIYKAKHISDPMLKQQEHET